MNFSSLSMSAYCLIITMQARDSLVDAKGVFARTPLKRGTVLGAYPGRVRSEADMVDKATVVPVCRSYVFKYAL